MGSRDEVCVTFAPGEQRAEEFAERLRDYLKTDPRRISAELSEPDRTALDDLRVVVGSDADADAAVDDHVYAAGVTWTYTEAEDWRAALRSFPTDCEWFLDVHTQEAGYLGRGHLYYLVGDEYVQVDRYWTTDGGYADELIDYFAVEHDLRPLTYSLQRLD